MFRILDTNQVVEWNSLVDACNDKDIYHSVEYAKIFENSYGHDIDEAFCGKSLMFVYGDDNEYILYPFTLREIKKSNSESEQLFDILSHYGYGGPIFKNNNCSEKIISDFIKTFHEFCNDNNIVSEFIRFNPLLNNSILFERFFNISKRNQTVIVDLTKNSKIIFNELNKKTRNQIRKAIKNGIVIERSNKSEDLEIFVKLYLSSMKRVGAHSKYLFPLLFFKTTIDSLGKNIEFFVAKHNGRVISGALFIHKYGLIHYHFSGTDSDYRCFYPNNLLIWTVILWAKENGLKKFHLGGGNNNNDSLFHFKSGFSDDRGQFYTASIIHNAKIYKKLCGIKYCSLSQESCDFFPYYRKPVI